VLLLRLMLTAVALVGGLWGVVALVAWVVQRRLIYMPLTSDLPPVETLLPGAEEVTMAAGDGLRLGAWFVPAHRGTDGPVVIVFNGNAGDRSFRAPLADELARAGMSVLLFDYRGYGGNLGKPTEAGLAADARAARDYLIEVRGVPADRIIYYGESLGSAVAIGLAAEHPPAALVLRSPFRSLVHLGRKHYPILPVGLLLRDRFAGIERIASVASPVLVIAGDRDAIVPLAESQEIWAAASEPKRLVTIAGADHNDAALLVGDRMMAEMLSFVREFVGPVPGDPG
jgi:fermentation-respiration switch protein FrsA (DUF1100 family)